MCLLDVVRNGVRPYLEPSGTMYGLLQDMQESDYSKRAEIGKLGYLGSLHCSFPVLT